MNSTATQNEISLTPSHETGRVDLVEFGIAYNIQMARDAAGVWFQRHIWLRAPHLTEPRTDAWIVSGTGRTGPTPKMRELVA